jgi:hypothetical protein
LEILAPLAPYADKLLYGVGVLLIIALLGGSHIHIKDINLGPVGGATRAISAIAGVLLLLAFLLTPEKTAPDPTFPIEGKLVVGIFPQLAGKVANVAVEPPEEEAGNWLKPAREYHAHVDPDGGNFLFPKTEGIAEGNYRFGIYYRDGTTAHAPIVIREGSFLLVVDDPGGTRQILTDPTTFFKQQYAGGWAKQIQAMEHMGDLLLRHRETYYPKLSNAYVNDQTDLRELALWSLGRACEPVVKDELEAIYADDSRNPFARLRAGHQLICFPDRNDKLQDLYARAAEPLPESAGREERVLKRLAAFYLLKWSRSERCVIDALLHGEKFSQPDAETMVLTNLANWLNWNPYYMQEESVPFSWSMEDWKRWFEAAKDDLPSCPTA